MSTASLTPVVASLSAVSNDELEFFAERLAEVPDILDRLETLKLHGFARVADIAAVEVKSTPKTTTPDIVDLGAIDHTIAIQKALFGLVRNYEASVRITVRDANSKLVQMKTKCNAYDTDTMIKYLLNYTFISQMRYQPDFDDDIVEVIEVIQSADMYTIPATEKPIPVDRNAHNKTLLAIADKVRNSVHDTPMTVVEVVRFLKLKKYDITNERVRQWVAREQLLPDGMVGKRPGYMPSSVMDVYNKMVTK